MSYLRSSGRAAQPVMHLAWGLIGISVLVVSVIGVLVAIPLVRAAPARSAPLASPVARGGSGLAWIYIGVGISTLVLLAIVVWTLFTLAAVASPFERPAFTIEIHGHQWWWEARYLGTPASRTFVTANELHIPVGRAVRLELIGDDVIHSFWIPALAGKTDVIPGQTNLAWIEADAPGVYVGQCTEYCGGQHAHMAAFAIAEPAASFDRWWAAQVTPAANPPTGPLAHGAALFDAHCAACHAVRGTAAGGILGPDLTHVMSRRTIAAGALTNDSRSLAAWIENAQRIKPGCAMPTLNLNRADLAAVVAYVQTLR